MRCRLLHPSFFSDARVVALPPLARLLFAGLWCAADREGRLEDSALQLKLLLLPADNCDVEPMLGQLDDVGLVQRYKVGARAFIAIPAFADRQHPHHREPASKIPPPKPKASRRPASGQPAAGPTVTESVTVTGDGDGDGDDGQADPGPEALVALWNDVTKPPLPRVTTLSGRLSGPRAKAARAALERRSLDDWRAVFSKANGSAFCRGETGNRGWRADFDWAIRPEGAKPEPALRLLEGAYDTAAGAMRGPTAVSVHHQVGELAT